MPKPQKYRDVARFLRSQGWIVVRQPSGSHVIWGDGNGNTITIARHRDVSVGVIRILIGVFPNTAPHNWK